MNLTINRIINYLSWMKDEYLGNDSVTNIYDNLVINNTYDNVVDYSLRVAGFKKALTLIRIKPTNVLDLACGTGAMIDALDNKNTKKIIGVDISKGMLEVARKRFKNYPAISLLQQDFMGSSFPNSTFDLITIAFATRFVKKQDESKFVEKVHSWLKKDGIFLVINMVDPLDYFTILSSRLIGYPKGFNTDMNQENYFIKKISTKFRLKGKTKINTQYYIYRTMAYFFTKT